MSAYNKIINKIKSFRSAYYLDKFKNGIVLFTYTSVLLILMLISINYIFYFNILTKSIIFYTSLILLSSAFIYLVLRSLLLTYNILTSVNYEKVAKYLSKHIPRLKDKLINALDLYENSNHNKLLESAIEQKYNEFSDIDFKSVINRRRFHNNLGLLFVLVIGLSISIYLNKNFFLTGFDRYVNYNVCYAPPSKIQFITEKSEYKILSGQDLRVEAIIKGELDDYPLIVQNNNEYLLKRLDNDKYVYLFKSVNNSFSFRYKCGKYSSHKIHVKVFNKPMIVNQRITITPPKYLEEPVYEIENRYNVSVKEGSIIKWNYETRNTDSLYFITDKSKIVFKKRKNKFSNSKIARSGFNYSIVVNNKNVSDTIPIDYSIKVVKDKYPEIQVKYTEDSIDVDKNNLSIYIEDDYGFSSLNLVYEIDNKKIKDTIPIRFNRNILKQKFLYVAEFDQILDDSGKINYWFEVRDNDAFNGLKKSSSKIFTYLKKSKEELNQIKKKEHEKLSQNISKIKSLTRSLQMDLKMLERKSKSGNLSEWERKHLLNEINRKRKIIEDFMKKSLKNYSRINSAQNQMSDKQRQVIEKQKKIQEMLKNSMDQETKNLLKQLQDLKKKFSQKKLNKLNKKMKINLDDMLKKLDRNLEVLKKQKLENNLNFMSKKFEEHSKLMDSLMDKNASKSKLDSLKKEISKDLKKIDPVLKENKEMENPLDLDKVQKQKESLEKDLNKDGSSEEENKENMKNISRKLKKMSEDMKQQSPMSMGGGMSLDPKMIDMAYDILEKLIYVSFEYENNLKLLDNAGLINKYIANHKHVENVIEPLFDSVDVFLKKSFFLDNTLSDAMKDIRYYNIEIEENITDGQKYNVAKYSKYAYTGVNKMALLISEFIEQVKEMMKKGGGKGKKPKNSSKRLKDMKQQQQGLKDQLEQMIEKYKDGMNSDNPQLNEDIGKMLSENEKFNQQLEQLMKGGEISKETSDLLKQVKHLNDINKRMLINKKIDKQLINRQKQIVDKLLKSEHSEKAKEIDKKERKSKEFKGIIKLLPKDSLELEMIDDNERKYPKIELENYYQKIFNKYQKTTDTIN